MRNKNRRGLYTAHEDFVDDGRITEDVVPTVVSQSWLRSRAAGVATDASNLLHTTYVQDLDLQRRLVECAAPILDRLHVDLSGMPFSVALTDEHARVLIRRDSGGQVGRLLDSVCFAPGFDYSENIVGTNGVGTAREAGMPVYIDGPQHFQDDFQNFTCAAAPIHNPLTRRLEGLIDVSCKSKHAHPMMQQFAVVAARDIESALQSTGFSKQQNVLSVFLLTCRRSRGAVYSLSCGVFMSNTQGARLLDPVEEAYLREAAYDLLAPGPGEVVQLVLPSGQAIRIRRHLVRDAHDIAGVVLEVDPIDARTHVRSALRSMAPLPGLAGTSGHWTRCCTEVAALAAESANVLIIGEPGTGKTALARGVHLYRNPQAGIGIVDCADSGADIAAELTGHLTTPATAVVLRRIDQLDDDNVETVAGILASDQHSYPVRWLAATASTESDLAGKEPLLQHFSATVTVPALRHHNEDIPAIAASQLKVLAPHREADIDTDALHALVRYQWPGNIAELVEAIQHAIRSKPAGDIGTTDLPRKVFTAPRRSMTTMEAVERDTIVKALQDNNGNRLKAAQQLGIARSSLYRKIDSYKIRA
jgi:transcriptional regulator of acetoin/glycerol metabolism